MAKKKANQKRSVGQSKDSRQAIQDNLDNHLNKKEINSSIPKGEGIPEIESDLEVLEADSDLKSSAKKALSEIENLQVTLKVKIEEYDETKRNYEEMSIGLEKNERHLVLDKKELDSKNDVNKATKETFEKRISELDEREKTLILAEEHVFIEKQKAKSGFVQEQRLILSEGRKEVERLQIESLETFSKKTSELKLKESLLLEKEIDLCEREANAESGFVDNQKSINAELEKEKVDLEKKLKDLRGSVAIQVDEKKKLIDEYQNKKMNFIDAEKEKLATDFEVASSIKKQAESEMRLLQARQRSQKEWESEIERKVLHRYDTELKDLTSQLEQERISRESDGKRLLSLHEQLRQYRDLERALEDQDIESVQEELSNSRRVIKELKAKIHSSGQDDLAETCEVLEGRIEDQNEEITDLRRSFEEASTELHTTRLSVQGKHNLAKEKRVLELHNRTLDIAIKSLETQLDELVEKQQGSKPFPVLSKLDQEFRREPANLQVVPGLKDFAEQIRMGLASIDSSSPLYFREEDIRLFLAGLAMSSLHILQGMSGTGKTSLATVFAKVVGGHCTLIPIQAGWRDKDDLVGHYNAFEKKFYEKEVLQAIYKAQLPAYRDRLNLIVLDEMNLSRPEQYFAEFLSAMEIKAAERNIVLVEEEQNNAPNLLIEGRKIKVPENIWFIGTANHDETTNEFADKTYDRAHVMELQRNEKTFSTDRYEPSMTYSFDSLQQQFDSAVSKHGKKLAVILSILNNCELSLILEEYFEVRWGNRLDRHAKRFIPVMIETGGTLEEGLDHLLATKVFRRGKVTGRFDINVADLDAVAEALVKTWSDELNLSGQPNHSLACITKDKKRMERNA
jgi:hypothetical protein